MLALEAFAPEPSRNSLRPDPPLLDETSLPPQSDDSRRELESRVEDRVIDLAPPLLPPLTGLRNPAEFVDEVDGVLTPERSARRTWRLQTQIGIRGDRGGDIIMRLLYPF